MRQEVNPNHTPRSEAFRLWMPSPMPMVTLTKTLDVTPLYRMSRRRYLKFNMLMCWCIGKAASQADEFYLLPDHDKLYRYDRLAINVIANNNKGGISSCDIPYADDLTLFDRDYQTLTLAAIDTCQSSALEDSMIIGTSSMIDTELDSINNQYTELFCNPLAMWGKYRKHWCRVKLPLSFQFHHVQMDGGHAARFLERLQKIIHNL